MSGLGLLNLLTSPLPSMSMLTQLHDLYVLTFCYTNYMPSTNNHWMRSTTKLSLFFTNICTSLLRNNMCYIGIILQEFIFECIRRRISKRYTNLKRTCRIVSFFFIKLSCIVYLAFYMYNWILRSQSYTCEATKYNFCVIII